MSGLTHKKRNRKGKVTPVTGKFKVVGSVTRRPPTDRHDELAALQKYLRHRTGSSTPFVLGNVVVPIIVYLFH